MHDIITFGSASWDVFLKPKKFQVLGGKKFARGKGLCLDLGSKIDLEDIFISSGGGGTNTAATFANQGFKTAYCGRIGDDIFGQEIVKELKGLKIDTSLVLKTKLKPTNYSVIFNTGPKKDKTVLAYRGASELLTKKDIPWKKLKAKWFYLAPLSGKSANLTEYLVNFAHGNGIKIAFNPGKSQLSLSQNTLKRILKKVDVLFLNREEAGLLTKIPYNKQDQIFKKLDQMTPGIVLIGASKGIKASDNKKIYQFKSSKVKIADKTGAGDAFASGFITGLIRKNDIEYAIKLGMSNSASCIQKWGAKQGLLKR
jgi:ribokinase